MQLEQYNLALHCGNGSHRDRPLFGLGAVRSHAIRVGVTTIAPWWWQGQPDSLPAAHALLLQPPAHRDTATVLSSVETNLDL